MSKKRIISIVFVSVTTFLWVCFIFANSLKPAQESSKQSSFMVDFIVENVLSDERNAVDEDSVDTVTFIVRKTAHFIEFFVLSLFASSLCYLSKLTLIRQRLYPFLFSFLIACADEFIQYFVPGRACQFGDVVLDTCAAIMAVLFFMLIEKIIMRIAQK